jgi:hypothetical protein
VYVKESEGLQFSVNASALQNWVGQFRTMKANGVRLPILRAQGHTEAEKAAAKLRAGDGMDNSSGWVHDLFVQGDSLWASGELIGEDAILASDRNDVSVYSPAKWKDGKGNDYQWPILHVLICPDPLVPGLSDFVPLAASRSANMPDKPYTDDEKKKMAEAMKSMASMLGIEAELGVDDMPKSLAALAASLKVRLDKLAASAKTEASPEVKLAASRAADPMFVGMAAKMRTAELDRRVEAGKLGKASRDLLHAHFVGPENKALAASIHAGGDGRDFDLILEALDKNDPIRVGEKSGAQRYVQPDPLKASSGGNVESPLVANAKKMAQQYATTR